MDTPFTPISEIGEFGLIERLRQSLGDAAHADRLAVPIGDDAAVSTIGEGRAQVLTTDLFVEGVHFDRTFAPLRALGWKCIAASVSDVCAMNAEPTLATVALGIPNNLSVENAETLYTGIGQACERYGLALAGGDITASARLVISVTVLGEADSERVVTRAGTVPGEVVCITGDVGASAAGLQLLLKGKEALAKETPGGDGAADLRAPELADFPVPIERHLMPQARLDRIRLWHEAGFRPTSLIDVSDGVASEAHHLSVASTVGITLEAGMLPVHRQTMAAAELLEERAEAWALYGGEDYELLFTTPKDALSVLPEDTYAIVGEVVEPEEGVSLRMPDGTVIPLDPRGFTHF